MKPTMLLMWTLWGYRMTPQVFESKKSAVSHGRWMRRNGYISKYKAITIDKQGYEQI